MYPNGGNGVDPDGLLFATSLLGTLRRERERLGWTVQDLAKRSGVNHSVIARAERFERFPGVPVLVRICRALGITMTEACRRAEIYSPDDGQA